MLISLRAAIALFIPMTLPSPFASAITDARLLPREFESETGRALGPLSGLEEQHCAQHLRRAAFAVVQAASLEPMDSFARV